VSRSPQLDLPTILRGKFCLSRSGLRRSKQPFSEQLIEGRARGRCGASRLSRAFLGVGVTEIARGGRYHRICDSCLCPDWPARKLCCCSGGEWVLVRNAGNREASLPSPSCKAAGQWGAEPRLNSLVFVRVNIGSGSHPGSKISAITARISRSRTLENPG
jgi:hypothetical protein